MTTKRRWVVASPVGYLGLCSDGEALTGIELGVEGPEYRDGSPFLAKVEKELGEYFLGGRKVFTVPFKRPEGATAYRNRVWDGLLGIPYGETLTYGGFAREIGGSARSVGGACGSNPVPIIIPCHRVVAVNGLGGYAGDWEREKALSVKKVLLELEERNR